MTYFINCFVSVKCLTLDDVEAMKIKIQPFMLPCILEKYKQNLLHFLLCISYGKYTPRPGIEMRTSA
jgi:hypothetical protein